jgi:GNAT superfamily N-acetyltransferase
MRLQTVPFDESHIAPFTAWFNALPNNNVWTEQFVRLRTLLDQTYDPELMIAAQENGVPVGFVLGSVANETGWIRAFLVRPGRQRQGIGHALFDQIEQTLVQRGLTEINVGWALPKYLLPGIDVTYTPAIVFLDRLGYRTNRESRVNMDVQLAGRNFDTTGDEARLCEHGFSLRRATPDDRAGITRLCETHDHLQWVFEAGLALDYDPVTLFVAERENQICAFAAHSVCGPVYFGPMLTSEDIRGQGIGSVLLKRCLQDWQQAGLKHCEIMWAGPLSFYARAVGATIGRAFWTFHKSLQPQ